MPETSSILRAFMSTASQPRALALFTDRDDQRAAIDAYLSQVREGKAHESRCVLSFSGVGGAGKTTLRVKALSDFREKLKSDLHDSRSFAIPELDFDTCLLYTSRCV